MNVRLRNVDAGPQPPPNSLGPGTPEFRLWLVSELPVEWAQSPDEAQLAEAARSMEVPVGTLQAHTFVELPDCPWGRAYHRWATAELDRLAATTPLRHVPILVSNLEDFRATGRSEEVVLRFLLQSGKPPPYFGRAFAPIPAGWRGDVRT